ncbi:sensory box histidine kinase/response regulator [hydrothermal vent metagenome]|uniref:histidine kinase n=1 Tax=hydrothermal vent metagenome TaxID=652676 RepID=A0A3B0XD48_9ZZZZ
MNLQFKLLFPIIAGYILLATSLHFLWLPLLLEDAKKNYQKNEQLILSSIEPEIIRNLISNDIATLHTFLDRQIKLHMHDWVSLKVSNHKNVIIYPLEEEKDTTSDSSELVEIQYPLIYSENKLGELWIVIDWSYQKNIILNRLRQLEIYLLLTFGLIIFISIVWQHIKIAKPLTLLSSSIKKLAEGDEDVKLPYMGTDEIGQLAEAFNNMLLMRQKSNEELKQLTQQAEAAYNELREQKYVLDNHSIVSITDLSGNITYANERFSLISGYKNEELMGKNHRMVNSGKHDKHFFSEMYNTLSNGKIWSGDICNRSKTGELYWVKSTIAPIMSADGKPQNYIAIRTDITEQKKSEKELIHSKNIAEDAVRAKSDFLASMSHEIRTPMNGVLGMLSLLQNTNLDKEQQHRLMLAKGSAQSLLVLINDILDFSKVDAGKMELEFIDFNLRDLLGELVEAMTSQIKNKDIELILDTTGIEYSMVVGDPGRLRQTLTNIISNAIKFTEQGEILIRVNLESIGDEQWQLNASISDTGIGIPSEKTPVLFDSFSQVDSSTTRVYGGTGLGLAIVKKLCNLMGGSINVRSELNKGSCFEFNIQLQKSKLSQQVLPKTNIQSLNLLVVDDNATNREVLSAQLENWGASVCVAESAQHALNICEERINNNQLAFFDIAFLDMQMPVTNGAELGKKLKADPRFKTMKLIMMTSMSSMGDAKYYSNLGFSGFFPKPATTINLFEALSVVVEDGAALQQTRPLVNHHYLKELIHEEKSPLNNNLNAWPKNMRLLLVEDNKVNQLVATGVLNDFGLQVDIAENGTEALTYLQQAEKDKPYTVILMDCQMPVMDGYEATRQIRLGKAGEINKHITIIAMTANAMAGDKQKCLDAGMDDYLTKPIESELLLKKLNQWCNKITIAENDIPASENTNHEKLIAWDKDAVLKRLMGKEDLLKTLLQVFLDENPTRLQDLQAAIENNDSEQARYFSHTIKGVAATLSCLNLQQQSALIEEAAKENNMAEIKSLMPALIVSAQEITTYFEDYL